MSEWYVASVLVHKKTDKLRYCIDYRALNAKTYKDNFSRPSINDCMDVLYGKNLFCVLDLCLGYIKYVLKRVSFGSKDCTKEMKLECAYFLGQTS